MSFFTKATRPRDGAMDPDVELLSELYGPLRRFAAVVAPADTEPDDLVQEALERALRIRPLHEFEDALTYLRRAMFNIASNVRRSSLRQQRAFARLTRSAEPAPATYPSDLALLQELRADVRAVLYLAEVEGWAYAAIGELLGCSEGAARARATRGRRALRSVLETPDD